MNEKIQPFKDRLKTALNYRNLRAVDICNVTKISQSTMSQYLSGYAEPKKERLNLIAGALKVDPTWLMGLDVPMEKASNKSTVSAFHAYLESLGYRLYIDDPEHKPSIITDELSCRLEYDTMDNLKLRIDSFTKATMDSELLALQEEELRRERFEKEQLIKHLQGQNIYAGSNFEKDYLEVRAAHQRTDIEIPDGIDTSDDDIMDDDNF